MLQLSQSTMLPPRGSGLSAAAALTAPQAHPMQPPAATVIARAHSQPARTLQQQAHQHPLKARLHTYKAAQSLNERTGTSGDPAFAVPAGMAERRANGSDDGDR